MRRNNPYYVAPSGNYDAIGQGITNLASVFMNTPSAADTAKTEALAWQARGAKQDQEFAAADREEMGRMANLFEMYDEQTYDPRQVLATGLRAGMDQGDLAQLFLTSAGNLGMSDERRAGGMVGTGRALGPNDAMSVAHQTRLRDENTQADLAAQGRDSVVANAFLEGGAEAATAARDAMYFPSGGPKPLDPWTQAAKRAELEAAVVAELDYIPKKLGGPDTDAEMPAEVYDYILPRAMELVMQGYTPASAVTMVSRDMNLAVDRDRGLIPFDRDDFEYTIPSRQTRAPTAPAAPAPLSVPPAEQRVPGQVYNTPKGPMVWVVQPDGQSGWAPAGA